MDISRRSHDEMRGAGVGSGGDQTSGRAAHVGPPDRDVGDGVGDNAGDDGSNLVDVGDAALTELLRRARGPLDWRTLSSRDAATTWGELRDWVGWLRTECGFDHRVVPPCWYRHRGLVSVLCALHDHWLAAYDPMGSLLGPGEWHRGLMHLETRLREWAARTGCTIGEHRADVLIGYPADADAWQAHVADDVADRQRREQQQRTAGTAQDPQLPIPLALVPQAARPCGSGGAEEVVGDE